MSNDFLEQVKSTIDKSAMDLVSALSGTFSGLTGADIDNLVNTDEVFKSQDPAILWQFLTLLPSPKDPLYRMEFLVGAKTVSDSSNHILTALNNEVRKTFEVETRISVGDYSGAVAVENTGYFLVVGNTYAPQQYEHMSGIRFFHIVAKGQRFI